MGGVGRANVSYCKKTQLRKWNSWPRMLWLLHVFLGMLWACLHMSASRSRTELKWLMSGRISGEALSCVSSSFMVYSQAAVMGHCWRRDTMETFQSDLRKLLSCSPSHVVVLKSLRHTGRASWGNFVSIFWISGFYFQGCQSHLTNKFSK